MLAAPVADLALTALSDWMVIRLRGPEAVKFLQGQVTCDVTQLGSRQLMTGAHCDFKGKVWMLFWLVALGEDLLLVTGRDSGNAALPELKKYAVFSKVTIDDVTSELMPMGLFGLHVGTVLDTVPSPDAPVQAQDWGLAIRLPWPALRLLCLVSDETAFRAALRASPEAATTRDWRRMDIEAGYPMLPSPLVNQYVPQALNAHLLDAISFTKGCYMGQETVARMKYRGGNKRGVFRLIGCGVEPEPGSDIQQQMDDGNWRRVGVTVQAAGCESCLEVLAILPLDTHQGTQLRVADQDSSRLDIAPLPYAISAD